MSKLRWCISVLNYQQHSMLKIKQTLNTKVNQCTMINMVIMVMIMKWYDYIGQTVNGILQTIIKGQKSSHLLQYTK